MEARTLPKMVLYAARVKNGPICDRYIMLCFHHSGPSQNTSFLLPFCHPKMVKNRVLHRGRQKGLKSEVPGDTMTRHGVHMGLQGWPGEAQGSPKASQNSSKIEVLGSGWPPRLPKAPPGSKKSPKLKENRCKTPARPRGKIRDSDAPQEAFPRALPQNPAEKKIC